MKRITTLLVSMLLAGIAAAGISVADPPAAEAASGGYVVRCGGGKIFLNAAELRLYALHNQARKNNLRGFCVHPALQKAARAHTADVIRRNYFSHETKGTNESACERVRRYGYRYRYCGENIGAYPNPDAMFKAWMQSPEHRGNILNGKFREIGIGAGRVKANQMKFTVDFGTRL